MHARVLLWGEELAKGAGVLQFLDANRFVFAGLAGRRARTRAGGTRMVDRSRRGGPISACSFCALFHAAVATGFRVSKPASASAVRAAQSHSFQSEGSPLLRRRHCQHTSSAPCRLFSDPDVAVDSAVHRPATLPLLHAGQWASDCRASAAECVVFATCQRTQGGQRHETAGFVGRAAGRA